MEKLKRAGLVGAILAGSLILDQVTKQMAIESLRGQEPISMLGGLARLTYAENHGAMLSLGAEMSDDVRFWVFQAGVTTVLLAMLGFVLLRAGLTRLQIWGLSLLVGGGLGNVIDRALYDGGVVDFMVLGKGWLKTGVFNVADIAIMVGCGLLLISTLREPGPQAEAPKNTTEDAPPAAP